MNILIPYNWLLEHLETKATPEQISKYLSLCGPTVERIETIENESVFDIEVTTNRVDVMSVRGIAREASAILPQFGIKAKLKPIKFEEINFKKPLDIKIISNPSLCNRTVAIKLSNIKIAPSPKIIQKRLTQVGQRPLYNIVDITNYVMWEIGHPIHVFDYDKLVKKKIIVRVAKKGEKLISLDNKTHILFGGEIVFDDGTGTIIDLPGIMGTKNTIVSENTKNILLWIESIDPQKTREASMKHAIRTQAAILNEKGVDPELALPSIKRSVELYKKFAKASLGSNLIDIYHKKPKIQNISLPKSKLENYLGLDLPPKKVIDILSKLGCQAHLSKKLTSYLVSPPSYRLYDMQIPQDIIEEIARIYGYHNLPTKLMATEIPDNPPSENFQLEHKIKLYLADCGLSEVYTYSMVSKGLALFSGYSLKDHLKIKNPLLSDMVYLRRSLIPSHLEVLEKNKNFKNVDIFEMANVYLPRKNNLPTEELQLVITSNQKFSFIKGILDVLLKKLYLSNAQIVPTDVTQLPFINHKTAEIYSDKHFLGNIGEIKQNISTKHVFAIQILVKPLLTISHTHPRYIPTLITPPIIEDLTFTLPEKTYLGEVLECIKSTSKTIEKVTLSKTFKTNYTFTIIYRHPKKSLTDNDILPLRKKVKNNVETKFQAKLVGKL